MTPNLDVKNVQQALDALINGDDHAAASRFTRDVVLTGVGGCLGGRAAGLLAVLDRFAEMSRLTQGTYGTEVEAIYTGNAAQLVAVTRHWAMFHGIQVHGTQALLITLDDGHIGTIGVFSSPGPPTGIWD